MDHATLDIILNSLNPGLDDNLPIDEHYVYVGAPRFDTPEVLGEDDLVVILDNGSYWDRHAAQFSPHDFTWRYHSAPLNLFEVIDHLLKSNGYLWRDISWIGSRDLEIPILWQETSQFICETAHIFIEAMRPIEMATGCTTIAPSAHPKLPARILCSWATVSFGS